MISRFQARDVSASGAVLKSQKENSSPEQPSCNWTKQKQMST